jgi:hypothetical protein
MCDENGLTLAEPSKIVRKSKAPVGSKHKVSINYFALLDLSDVIHCPVIVSFTSASIYDLRRFADVYVFGMLESGNNDFVFVSIEYFHIATAVPGHPWKFVPERLCCSPCGFGELRRLLPKP